MDGDLSPLPVLVWPLSVDLRATDDVGVLPDANLGIRLGVVESRKYTYVINIIIVLRLY